MNKLSRISAALFVIAELSVLPAFAYETELSESAVREAYFLGQRHDEKTGAFLAQYTKYLPKPKSGPQISEVRLLTPLAQIVQVSQLAAPGYNAQQARLDYQKRGDSILLTIHIEFTPTYNLIQTEKSANRVRADQFWQDFRFRLKQKGEWIEPRSTRGEPEYKYAVGGGSKVLVGAWVYLEYDTARVSADDTEVHVLPPEGEEVTSSFDLTKVR